MDPENIVSPSVEEKDIIAGDKVEEVEEIELKDVEEPEKEISIADAIKKAMEQSDSSEEKKTALPAQEGIEQKTKEPGKEIDPITGRVLEPIKAPGSLTPALREKWKDVDPRFQKFFIDREREIANTMNDTVEARRLANSFKEIASPYEPMLRKFGITAEQHTKELFNLSYSLNNGSPQEKAKIIFNMINHFQPDAATLEQLFNGQPVQAPVQQQPVNVEAEVQRILEQREAEKVERQADDVLTRFASKPGHEYYNDVRGMMGKIIEAGLVDGSGEELLENAYELACSRHPEIAQITQQRAPVQQPVRSVKPSLGGGRPAVKPQREMSLSEAVAQAVREHGL